MQIDFRRLYTHPVLAAGRDDYKTCTFAAQIKPSFEAGNLLLNVTCHTDCTEMERLIAEGDATYILHAECAATICREIFTSAAENFTCTIPTDRLKNHVDCMAIIALTRDVENFSCADWNDDFKGLTFDLQKGSVLAYQNFQPLKIADDQNIFKNVTSIFSVYRRVAEGEPFEVDLSQDKIKIGLSSGDYQLYRRYCSRPDMQPILNAMIILPALVYVFEELKTADAFEIYGAKGWFQSLKAAYRRRKIDNFAEHIAKDENTSIRLAQDAMNLPITKALAGVALISAEDS